MKRSFTKALNAGVKIIAGTDTAGFLAEDIALMRKFGLNSMESIRTATINSANALKLGNRIGSIEEGKIADLVLLDGDPLSDASNIEKVHMVFKEGVFYKPHDIRLDDSELQNALSR
jgi:imidazolonepropionase-like amidohydrolase